MKGVSNLLGLLMVAVITIAIFLAVSGIVGGFLARLKPKGSDLVLAGFVWWWENKEGGGHVLDIRGNWVTGQLIAKVYEQTVDLNIRCG